MDGFNANGISEFKKEANYYLEDQAESETHSYEDAGLKIQDQSESERQSFEDAIMKIDNQTKSYEDAAREQKFENRRGLDNLPYILANYYHDHSILGNDIMTAVCNHCIGREKVIKGKMNVTSNFVTHLKCHREQYQHFVNSKPAKFRKRHNNNYAPSMPPESPVGKSSWDDSNLSISSPAPSRPQLDVNALVGNCMMKLGLALKANNQEAIIALVNELKNHSSDDALSDTTTIKEERDFIPEKKFKMASQDDFAMKIQLPDSDPPMDLFIHSANKRKIESLLVSSTTERIRTYQSVFEKYHPSEEKYIWEFLDKHFWRPYVKSEIAK